MLARKTGATGLREFSMFLRSIPHAYRARLARRKCRRLFSYNANVQKTSLLSILTGLHISVAPWPSP